MTAFVLSAVFAVAAPVPKDADARFEKDVAKARERAIEFLKKQQTKDGNWEGIVLNTLTGMDGGATGLVTLALHEAGVPADDPTVAKAVEYLVKLEPRKTYVVSLQTQVLARVDAKKHAKLIQRNADWLLEKAIRDNGKLTGWSYPGNAITDGSNTHFAVVALHAAAEAGAKVEEKLWGEVRDLYDRTQSNDGWWSYYTGHGAPPTRSDSMTACGLLGLTITTKHDRNAKGPGREFEKGLKVLVPWNFENSKSVGYALFTVAEFGRAAGKDEFKAGDETWAWYRQGAKKLLFEQKEDGSWKYERSIDKEPVLATAFGLYFLGPPKK